MSITATRARKWTEHSKVGRQMKITIKQIAEIAGVHRSTVDKVLHNREGVSDEVRAKVQKIIEDLDYEPNMIGKALASQKNPLTIAVLLLQVDALAEIRRGVEKAKEELSNFGLNIEYYYSNANDDMEQRNTLKLVKKKKVDGVIIAPIDTEGVRIAINDLEDTGIPVITVNTDVSDCKRMAFVGQDGLQAGRVAGSLMGEILGKRGSVAIISGDLSCTAERAKGFEEIIGERFENISIVGIVDTLESGELAFQGTLNILNNYNIDGLFITTGNVNEVMKALKLKGKVNTVKVVCFDLYDDIVGYLKEGAINFTIGQDLQNQGYKAVKTMFDYRFLKKHVESPHIKTAIDIRLRDNV